jgi:hypothetical protein
VATAVKKSSDRNMPAAALAGADWARKPGL